MPTKAPKPVVPLTLRLPAEPHTAPAALAASRGRYVIRTQTVKSLDGPAPERFVVISFDSAEKAQAWNDSPATKEITAARIKSTDSLSFIVEGVAN